MKILFVENHARFARITAQHFLSHHEVVIVPSLAAARLALSTSGFDAVLLDYDLDDGKGVELFPMLQHLPRQPFVVGVSSHDKGNNALLTAGADAICPNYVSAKFTLFCLLMNRSNEVSK